MILAITNLTACAGYDTKYQSVGKYRSISEINESKVLPSDVDIFVQEYPEGFTFKDGVVYLEEKDSGHKILGNVSVTPHGPNTAAFMGLGLITFGVASFFMMTPPDLGPDEAAMMIKEKAASMGGNAIIGASLPQDDSGVGMANGLVVYIP